MELPSGRRLRRSTPPPPEHGAPDPDGDDRLTALPDDMLLQILARLGCARAAARADVLARRWRGLWTRLPDLAFRDVPAAGTQEALARVSIPGVSLLEVRLPSCRPPADCRLDDARAKSLLRAAARLSPETVVFTLSGCRSHTAAKVGRPVDIVLPRFLRATSIEIDTHLLRIKPPPAGELPALETLSISGNIVDLGALLDRCPRLRMLRVTFRGVAPGPLEAGLATLEAAVAQGLVVSLLGIDGNSGRHRIVPARFPHILHAAARLHPREIVFTNNFHGFFDVDLPCFHRATSIEMDLWTVRFVKLLDGQFLALERFSLSRSCRIVDVVPFVTRCPRLRVLKVTADTSRCDSIIIHSTSLQELDLNINGDRECQGIDIATSVLKELKLTVRARINLKVFISAPMLEKVSVLRMYTMVEHPLLFGFWLIQSMKLELIDSYKCKDDGVLNYKGEDACSQLPRSSRVLSLNISAPKNLRLGVMLDIAQEMEKFMVTNFSVLELHLNPKGHNFVGFVLRLLRMRHIRTGAQRLKVVLVGRTEVSQTSKCLGNCPCNEPRNLKSKSISFTHLEEVEINYFRGGEHEIDFATLIFGWAPMLKRMTIRLTHEIEQSDIESCTKTIYNVSLAYPFVNCSIYLSSGKLVVLE